MRFQSPSIDITKLLRESSKFPNYNLREYSLRRVRDGFRENAKCNDPVKLSKLIADGEKNLELLRRQVIIHSLYKAEPLIIDNLVGNKNQLDAKSPY